MKKDNKGFSLVELIVVVLIMGILAVALTPQVMKWVNNSRISADTSTLDSVKETVNLALANEKAFAALKGTSGDHTYYVTVANNGFAIKLDTAPTVSADGKTVSAGSALDATLTTEAFIYKFMEIAGASVSSVATTCT